MPVWTFAKAKKAENKSPAAWIENPYSEYDTEKYFAAVGSDKYKNTAELKAVETLAGVFGRDVDSSRSAEISMSRTEAKDLSESSISSTLNEQITIEVDQEDLIGIEIAKSYYDEPHSTWYALAILDKEKTAALYSSLIEKNTKSINSYLNKAALLSDSLALIEKFTYFYNAYRLTKINESFYPRFFIISPEKCKSTQQGKITSEEIRIKLDDVSSKLPIAVAVSDDYNSTVQSSIEELLKSFGFTLSSASPKYSLNAQIDRSFRRVQNPTMDYCEFSVSLKMTEKTGAVLFPCSFSGRAGAKNKDLAEKKAFSEIGNKIKSEYKEIIETYLSQNE